MRICVVSLWTQEIESYAILTDKIRQMYCDRHGYEYLSFHKVIDDLRHPAWSKLLFMQTVMAMQKCDWVFWQDADAFPMNHDIDLESFIKEYPEYDVIIGNDPGVHLLNERDAKLYSIPVYESMNTGNMLWKNTEENMRIISSIYLNPEYKRYWKGHCWEQSAISGEYTLNESFRNRTKVIKECREFNAHPDNYQLGDFLIHFYARDTAERLRLTKEFAKTIQMYGKINDLTEQLK
jgi:hypothetical protein